MSNLVYFSARDLILATLKSVTEFVPVGYVKELILTEAVCFAGIILTFMALFSFFSSSGLVILLGTTTDYLNFNSEDRIELSGICCIEREGFIRRTIKTEGE